MAHFRREEGTRKEAINTFIRLSQEFQAYGMFCYENRNVQWWLQVIGSPKGDCTYADSVNGENFEFNEFHNKCHIATKNVLLRLDIAGAW